jgi:hypothetical protein
MAKKLVPPSFRRGGNKPVYEVLVGNVGTVVTTHSRREAEGVYRDYVAASRAGVGRAAGEAVALFAKSTSAPARPSIRHRISSRPSASRARRASEHSSSTLRLRR